VPCRGDGGSKKPARGLQQGCRGSLSRVRVQTWKRILAAPYKRKIQMTLTINVDNHQPQLAPADESTVKSLQQYNRIVTTFTDAETPGRHLRYFGSWEVDVVQRGGELYCEIREGATLELPLRRWPQIRAAFETAWKLARSLREKNVPFAFYFTGRKGFRISVRDPALFRLVDETQPYGKTAVEQVILPLVQGEAFLPIPTVFHFSFFFLCTC
jgi:hypothetical protein